MLSQLRSNEKSYDYYVLRGAFFKVCMLREEEVGTSHGKRVHSPLNLVFPVQKAYKGGGSGCKI